MASHQWRIIGWLTGSQARKASADVRPTNSCRRTARGSPITARFQHVPGAGGKAGACTPREPVLASRRTVQGDPRERERGEDPVSVGLWGVAEDDPARLAVVEAGGTALTFGDLAARSNLVLHGLRSAGLRRGDLIAAVLPNQAALLELALA